MQHSSMLINKYMYVSVWGCKYNTVQRHILYKLWSCKEKFKPILNLRVCLLFYLGKSFHSSIIQKSHGGTVNDDVMYGQ